MPRPHPLNAPPRPVPPRHLTTATLLAVWLCAPTACKGGDADMIPPPQATLPATSSPPSQTPPPQPPSPPSPPQPPSPPSPPSIAPTGFHPTSGGAALVFAAGMTRAEAEATIKEAVGAGRARVVGNRREQKQNQGVTADVHTYELAFSPGQAVSGVTLTLFSNTLVGVTTTYRDPDPARLTDLTAAHGPSQDTEYWHGWWLPAEDVILQLSTDTLTHEVFSLAAARPLIPRIPSLMQKSWLARYGQPPPWVLAPPPRQPPP